MPSEEHPVRATQKTDAIIIKARSRASLFAVMAIQSAVVAFVFWEMVPVFSQQHPNHAWMAEALAIGATVAVALFGLAVFPAYVGTLMYGSESNAE